MHFLYSIVLAVAILCVAPVVANLSTERSSGGGSVHFKTIADGVWPYQVTSKAERPWNTVISLPQTGQGRWI
jgi:hypothetical protein